MKKPVFYFDKKSKVATIMLYSLDDFKKQKTLDQLLKISDLFDGNQICARVIRKLNSNTFLDLKGFLLQSIARTRNSEVLAIRFAQDQLGYIVDYFAKNEERTEIYFFDEVNWDRFTNMKSNIDKLEYRSLIVINDNNDTYVKFKTDIFDFEYI